MSTRDKLLGFGQRQIEDDGEFRPMIVCLGPTGEDQGTVFSAPFENTQEKQRVFQELAFASFLLDASSVMFICDAHMSRYEPKPGEAPPTLDTVLPPSQDPNAIDALMVAWYDEDGMSAFWTLEYHRTDEGGITWEPMRDATPNSEPDDEQEEKDQSWELSGAAADSIGAYVKFRNQPGMPKGSFLEGLEYLTMRGHQVALTMHRDAWHGRDLPMEVGT